MRHWIVAGSVAAATSLLAACSLGALDGFSGGAADAGGTVVDAGAQAEDAGFVADASTERDPAAKRFCETLTTPPRFCLDFEDGTVPFGIGTTQTGGTVVIDDQGNGGTKGMTVTIPPDAANDGKACLHAELAGPRTGITVEADFRFTQIGSDNLELLNLYTANDRELGVSTTGTALTIEEERAVDGGTEIFAPATAEVKTVFQRFRFVAIVDGAVAHTELFVDGVSVAKHDAEAGNVTGNLTFQIGDCILAGADGWTSHYDNIVVYETK